MDSNPSLRTEDQRHVRMYITSRHSKRTRMRIWCCERTSARAWVRLPAHPKREEMNSRRKLGEAVCTPYRIEKNSRGPPSCDQPRVFLLGGFRVLILRLTSLCYFWRDDARIQRRRVGAVVGRVLENVINSLRDKLMYCPHTVYKERQCIEVAPIYHGEHSRKADDYVTELWLVDDLNLQVCWTLIGWRTIEYVEDWKRVDNVFQEDRRACYEEKSQKLT